MKCMFYNEEGQRCTAEVDPGNKVGVRLGKEMAWLLLCTPHFTFYLGDGIEFQRQLNAGLEKVLAHD